jgi:quinohemoprotein ethanol dehydrogenase
MKISASLVFAATLAGAVLASGCAPKQEATLEADAVEAQVAADQGFGAVIVNADATPGEWLSNGRTYSEQRHSPLTEVSTSTVADLGLAWAFDLGVSRGIEATPIVHDGVMYVTASWNIVYALDARTGAEIWSFDPAVDRSRAAFMCCDIVNRGVALWDGKIYTGTIDGRLIAIDAKTGEKIWDVNTIDRSKPYSITGAPRIVKGKVVIGNGGAEFGVRGYITAYDADSGDVAWRFYTVPGDPAKEPESQAMAQAIPTWNGEWWKLGGGGTVWDSMAYDPDLDLFYIGVGNGSPWNQDRRSPGGGDNLYLSSIVALRPDTGEYVWHYQTTPGETWDYTATQHMILADIEIDGALRKVIMQAPKNGFFYVIDRATGELLSAKNFVPVNWATHIDLATGRPVEVADARWPGKAPYLQLPGPLGAHNWHPMAYNPQTGLVYIPAQETPLIYADDPVTKTRPMGWNTGADLTFASLPSDEATFRALRSMLKGRLLAWDPVKQEAAWSFEHGGPWNGGVLSTAGGLVFQGTADAHLAAYDAATGDRLWRFFTQTGIGAPPISYELDGEQYIAVASGWGGAYALAYGGVVPTGSEAGVGRVLAFKLGADGALAELPADASVPAPPPSTASADTIAKGIQAYAANCSTCHGDHAFSYGTIPNLQASALLGDADGWRAVVHEGGRAALGMPNFNNILDADTVEAVRAYVISEANSGRGPEFYRAMSEVPN